MPNRLIREGINTSEKVDRLSLGAEIFYRRLLNQVDDWGRFSAHTSLLIAACYPLRIGTVSVSDIEGWLKEVVDVRGSSTDKTGLVICYEVDGKKYLQVMNFRQQRRSMSKYPPPPPPSENSCMADAKHMLSNCNANDHLVGGVFVVGDEGEDGYGGGDGSAGDTGDSSIPFCKREGKKTPARRFGTYVFLTDVEYQRMVNDWGKSFADAAIAEYDQRYPNSPAIRKHTDHNRAIRDYVGRKFICAEKIPHPVTRKKTPQPQTEEDLGTPEERAALVKQNLPSHLRDGTGMQPVVEILAGMAAGP